MGTSAAERETCPCLRTDYGHIVPGVKTPWNAMLTTTSTLYSIQRATDGGCRRSAGPKGLGIGRWSCGSRSAITRRLRGPSNAVSPRSRTPCRQLTDPNGREKRQGWVGGNKSGLYRQCAAGRSPARRELCARAHCRYGLLYLSAGRSVMEIESSGAFGAVGRQV